MDIFYQLSMNKGTVSSALGKTIARQVLSEDRLPLLLECIEYTSYEPSSSAWKQIRAGAAKVVELVAEKRPDLVAPHLAKLLPALAVSEPQTRWMVIRTMGFCAHLNPTAARRALRYAEKFLKSKEGVCLASSADLFLGDLGSVSKKDARLVFPLLEQSMNTVITNEEDWLLEACRKILPNLKNGGRERIAQFAGQWQHSRRKTTRQRAKKVLTGNTLL